MSSLPDQLSTYTIHLAADHAGLAHKDAVREWLVGEGLTVVDHGAKHFDAEDDFPDFVAPAAQAVHRAPARARGIIFGGSGQGEAMVANRFSHVRATVYYGGDEAIIRLSREHNDANVLSIGARFVSIDDTKRLIWEWLTMEVPEVEKYTRRNCKLAVITKQRPD